MVPPAKSQPPHFSSGSAQLVLSHGVAIACMFTKPWRPQSKMTLVSGNPNAWAILANIMWLYPGQLCAMTHLKKTHQWRPQRSICAPSSLPKWANLSTSWSKKVFTRSWSTSSAASSLQSAATRRASAKQPHRAELSTAAWLGPRCLYFITSIFLQEILKCSHYLKGGGKNTHELPSYP